MNMTDPLDSISEAGQAVVAQLQAEIHELEISFPGLTATKYLSGAFVSVRLSRRRYHECPYDV